MSRKFVFLCGCCLLCQTYAPLRAVEEVPVEQIDVFSEKEGGPSDFGSPGSTEQVDQIQHFFFKTIGLLAGLCGLIIGGGYFLKRLGGARIGTFGAENNIVLVERKYISPKTALWYVTIKDQPFIIVDSQQGVAIHSCNQPIEPSS